MHVQPAAARLREPVHILHTTPSSSLKQNSRFKNVSKHGHTCIPFTSTILPRSHCGRALTIAHARMLSKKCLRTRLSANEGFSRPRAVTRRTSSSMSRLELLQDKSKQTSTAPNVA